MPTRNFAVQASGPDFMGGGGEMGALIRAHDWSATSLGLPETWPPALRTTVRLLLHTQHPMYIWWGPDLLCFYNDGYRRTLGPERHPSSLGRPGREVWAEIWDQIGDQVDFVMSGQGSTWDENRLVGSTRFGRLDEIYWTYSYSPIDDQRMPNGVGGVLVVCTETTQAVQAERRQAFRLTLEERLRDVADPATVVTVASEALGTHLDMDQVAYAQIESGGETAMVERVWNKAEEARRELRHRLEDYGPAVIAELKDGRSVAVTDVRLDPRTSSVASAAFARFSVGAFLSVPVVKEGRLVAVLAMLSASPRTWSSDGIALAEDVAERIWSAAERARAQEALRHKEEAQRLILESALDYAIFTTDEDGIVTSWPPGAEAVFGWPRDEMIGQDIAVTFTLEDRAVGQPGMELETASRDGVAPNVRWHVRKDGRRIFIEGSTRPLRDGRRDGQRGYIKIGQDVTSRREIEQRQQVLVAELQHRTRNLMNVVRAMAAKTATEATSVSDFMPRFKERLGALSRSNDLLSRLETNQRVTFDEVMRTELMARGFVDGEGKTDPQVKLDGPPSVRLRSSAVQIFGLAIHELATNAVKYGALSHDGGRLEVSWEVRRDEAGRDRLVVEWIERQMADISKETTTPEGGGYGRTLIEKALPYQLQAKTTYELGPDGVRCTIDLPLN